jgi:hypothetical protein
MQAKKKKKKSEAWPYQKVKDWVNLFQNFFKNREHVSEAEVKKEACHNAFFGAIA